MCLDRGTNGREAFRRRVDELGLTVPLDDKRLHFFSLDMTQPRFGLSVDELETIFSHCQLIIHNMWVVNFALSLSSFRSEILRSVVTTIDLAHQARIPPRITFVSSIDSVQAWPSLSTPVPEDTVTYSEAAWSTGYAQSKHVAERLLARAAKRLNLSISILRLGQVAGPTTIRETGRWQSQDWIHSLAVLSKASGLIPNDLGIVDWIPVDLMARVVHEISTRPTADLEGTSCAMVYNLVHPRPLPFARFADALQTSISPSSSTQVGFADWLAALSDLPPNELPQKAEVERLRILPFFQSLASIRQPNITTTKTQEASITLANMAALDQRFLKAWCSQLV